MQYVKLAGPCCSCMLLRPPKNYWLIDRSTHYKQNNICCCGVNEFYIMVRYSKMNCFWQFSIAGMLLAYQYVENFQHLLERFNFYRVMHFSAKRGIAIACRLSVRPSVCLSVCPSVTLVDCDHIGWNSSKIISPLVSPGCSLFATPTWRVCSKGNAPKFGPTPCWLERRRHSIANCGRMVTDSATVTMESL